MVEIKLPNKLKFRQKEINLMGGKGKAGAVLKTFLREGTVKHFISSRRHKDLFTQDKNTFSKRFWYNKIIPASKDPFMLCIKSKSCNRYSAYF